MSDQTISDASPCVGVCQLNAHNLCTGCFRTADEIAVWSQLDADSKRAINQQVVRRQAQHSAA